MVIATYGDHPWIATVYFAIDENLNLYFFSNPSTIHCQQILSNPKVAVSVADAPQDPTSKKKGLQLCGNAYQLTEEADIREAMERWKKALKVNNSDYSFEGILQNKIKGRMFKVIPNKVKLFDQDLYEEGKEPLIKL